MNQICKNYLKMNSNRFPVIINNLTINFVRQSRINISMSVYLLIHNTSQYNFPSSGTQSSVKVAGSVRQPASSAIDCRMSRVIRLDSGLHSTECPCCGQLRTHFFLRILWPGSLSCDILCNFRCPFSLKKLTPFATLTNFYTRRNF